MLPPPISPPVSIEWLGVNPIEGIRITGVFDITARFAGQTERTVRETLELEVEAAILAVLIDRRQRAVN